eukprot:CAMPEP_0194264634 /NCGR_PEP_ID=MMETSP0158-20130606/47685_1 /TAXON_ID=33649 /ORGANISM="Thalassionema nitzschioides, Strain L26-B" /LENGTH=516 /DNA_ID=CAMNT_0039004879 /DNA_START=9 /DNA_END=1556 /DNA_ORIENTATION=+
MMPEASVTYYENAEEEEQATTKKTMKLQHAVPNNNDNDPVGHFVSKYCSSTTTTWNHHAPSKTMGLYFIFFVYGNIQSQTTQLPSLFVSMTSFCASLAIALYSDSITDSSMKRKPLLMVLLVGCMVCHLVEGVFLLCTDSSSWWLLGLTQITLRVIYTLANAMRVERKWYNSDATTFGICQIVQYLGWFLTATALTNNNSWFSSWSITMVLLVLATLGTWGPLEDYVAVQSSELQDQEHEHDDASMGWKVFDWLQTKSTLHCIIFTLVWNATLVSIQTMNVLDGLMEEWYVRDQWIYALSSLVATTIVAVIVYVWGSKKQYEQALYWRMTMIWIGSVVWILLWTGCGYLASDNWLRYGTNAIGTTVVVAGTQFVLQLLWLSHTTTVVVATSWCLLEWFRTGLSYQMGEQLFFITTFSYSYFWMTYVCWAILPLGIWWLLCYYNKNNSTEEQQEDTTMILDDDDTKKGGSTVLIYLTLCIVLYFALVQLYWMYGYPQIVANANEDDYYHSDDFWSDW